MSDQVIPLLQQLIRNECVNDGTPESGHEHRSVETLLEFFGVEGEVFEPAPGRQSLIYRVPGSDPAAPSLALAPHLDVVPVDPEGWSRDPFGAEIVDGMVYGRGAVDMLNVTAAMAVVKFCAERASPPFSRDSQPRRGASASLIETQTLCQATSMPRSASASAPVVRTRRCSTRSWPTTTAR